MSWLLRIFRAPKEPIEPFDFTRNRYPAKKKWPPDFAKLSEKEQFRFEKKFRRRNKLAWARPKWNKGTKLVQWGLIGSFVTYSVLFFDWPTKEGDPKPFEGVRKWYRNAADSIWTYSNTTMTAEDANRFRERRPPSTT